MGRKFHVRRSSLRRSSFGVPSSTSLSSLVHPYDNLNHHPRSPRTFLSSPLDGTTLYINLVQKSVTRRLMAQYPRNAPSDLHTPPESNHELS